MTRDLRSRRTRYFKHLRRVGIAREREREREREQDRAKKRVQATIPRDRARVQTMVPLHEAELSKKRR